MSKFSTKDKIERDVLKYTLLNREAILRYVKGEDVVDEVVEVAIKLSRAVEKLQRHVDIKSGTYTGMVFASNEEVAQV
jgi:DNA primase catalytic subunit